MLPQVKMHGECKQTQQSNVLKDLDTLLRCGICFEYMKTAMLLPACSHNYCSLCIRRYICYKEQCPTCRKPLLESDLRNNRLLDEIIDVFQRKKQSNTSCSSDLLPSTSENLTCLSSSAATNCISPLSKYATSDDDKKHKCDEQKSEFQSKVTLVLSDDDDPDDFDSVADTHSNSRQIDVSVSEDKKASFTECASVNGGDDDQHYKPFFTAVSPPSVSSPPSTTSSHSSTPLAKMSLTWSASNVQTTVSCPVCSVHVPERSINVHLDRCLRNDSSEHCVSVSKTPKRKPLPKLVYNLLADKELRKKLSDVGLPTHGHRKALIARHREYTLIYNAECDSLNPKSGSDIVREMLKADENKAQSSLSARSSSSSFSSAMLRVDKGASVDEVEAARKSYAREHKSQFQQLIEAARNNHAGLKKPALDVRDGEDTKDEVGDSESSASSVELIADSGMLLSGAACPVSVTDDNHNQLLPEQAVDDVATIATNKHQLNGSQPLVHVDSVTNSDLSNSLPATQVDNDKALVAIGDDGGRVHSPDLLGFLDDFEISAAVAASATSISPAEVLNAAAGDVSPVVQIRTKSRKQKCRSPVDDDDDSAESLEQLAACSAVSVGRCLRSRDSIASECAKKCRRSSELDEDNSDDDYEPGPVSRPKRRKRRRR